MGVGAVGRLVAAPIRQHTGRDFEYVSLYTFTIILIRAASQPDENLLGQVLGFRAVANPALKIGSQRRPETLIKVAPRLCT